jgi:hypothetical protein
MFDGGWRYWEQFWFFAALGGETISTASINVRERVEGKVDASETATVDLVPLEMEMLESEDTETTGFSSRGGG